MADKELSHWACRLPSNYWRRDVEDDQNRLTCSSALILRVTLQDIFDQLISEMFISSSQNLLKTSRWSTQRANDRYKDHLKSYLSRNQWLIMTAAFWFNDNDQCWPSWQQCDCQIRKKKNQTLQHLWSLHSKPFSLRLRLWAEWYSLLKMTCAVFFLKNSLLCWNGCELSKYDISQGNGGVGLLCGWAWWKSCRADRLCKEGPCHVLRALA